MAVNRFPLILAFSCPAFYALAAFRVSHCAAVDRTRLADVLNVATALGLLAGCHARRASVVLVVMAAHP